MDQCSNRCGPDAVCPRWANAAALICPRWANAVALICQRWANAATVVGPMLFANVGPTLHIGASLHWANVGSCIWPTLMTASGQRWPNNECLLGAIINSFGLDKSKLVGVTTDGESANIGRRNGFWKLLRTYLDRDIFSFWCVAHRSDLTVEVMEHAVPELQLWKANVLGVASYFRTRKNHKLIFLHCFLMHMNFQRILKFALLSTWLM